MTYPIEVTSDFYKAIAVWTKKFIMVLDDRPYKVGESLHMFETDPFLFTRTGKEMNSVIEYILTDELFRPLAGWCILSLAPPTIVH